MEVVRETFLEIGGESDVELPVLGTAEDIDAEREFAHGTRVARTMGALK